MKLTSLFIATFSLALFSACSQEADTVADVAEDAAAEVTAKTEAVKEEVKEVVETVEDAATAVASAALIDPNTAAAEIIAAIPGVGAELADQIIAGRPYATPTALNAVLKDAVDADALKAIYGAMFVKVGLNSGSEDDYKLIPSSLKPGHLAHEFEEYRPYDSMEQFAREMSKYVSAEEVINLQRYVTLD